MAARRHRVLLGILVATSLGGCSQTVHLYHDIEGGAIAKARQPPPGANLTYPNLADVPAPQSRATPAEVAAIAAQARAGANAASTQALAGLSLPTAPPPLPKISGLTLRSGMAAPAVAPAPQPPLPPPSQKVKAEPVAVPAAPPVAIAFPRGSALLPYQQVQRLVALAGQHRGAHIRVCGFGDGSLTLALARARRLANALTAAGVPAQEIELEALAAGSGGFVQFVY